MFFFSFEMHCFVFFFLVLAVRVHNSTGQNNLRGTLPIELAAIKSLEDVQLRQKLGPGALVLLGEIEIVC